MTFTLLIEIVFWIAVSAVGYTYLGYPLLVYFVSLIFPRKVSKKEFEPKVTILITAYNEEGAIASKIQNTFLIDYPKEKLEILVASDGSSDRTDEIVKEFSTSGVRLFHQPGRKGKTFTQNKAVELATGEIILFSDATTLYRTDVLRRLLPNFADEGIGCVAGKLLYVDSSGSDVGKGARGYWSYESFLRERESLACSLIGVSGCLYAVRKSAYQPMYPEACSDFLICTIVYKQGYRSIYEPSAICTEETNRRTDKEMKMRVRVISQTFTDLWRNRSMLNPFRSGFYGIELISHKLFRYFVPLYLFIIFFSSLVLSFSKTLFLAAILFQLGFYSFAFVAWLLEKVGVRIGIFAIPLYFVLTNIASLVGFYKFLRGESYATWEPIREV